MCFYDTCGRTFKNFLLALVCFMKCHTNTTDNQSSNTRNEARKNTISSTKNIITQWTCFSTHIQLLYRITYFFHLLYRQVASSNYNLAKAWCEGTYVTAKCTHHSCTNWYWYLFRKKQWIYPSSYSVPLYTNATRIICPLNWTTS